MPTVAAASGGLLRSLLSLRDLRGSKSETTKVRKVHEEKKLKCVIEVDRRKAIVRSGKEIE